MKKRVMVFVFASIFATLFSTLFVFAAGTDLNNDGATNRTDLSLLATVYRTSNATFDRNNDGTVNLFDMVSVAKNVSNGSSGGGGSNLTVYFQCDFPTTGNSSAAYMGNDCDTPFNYYNTNGWLSVRTTSGSGLDFPTNNFLLIESASTPDEVWIEIGFNETADYLPSPSELTVGSSLAIRDYYTFLLPSTTAQATHGDYYQSTTADGWGPETGGWSLEQGSSCYGGTTCAADKYELRWWTGQSTEGTLFRPWTPTRTTSGTHQPLTKGEVYRREVLWNRTATNVFKLSARIYQRTGGQEVLVAHSDNNTFVSYGYYDDSARMAIQNFTISTSGNEAGRGGLQGFIWGNNDWDNSIGGRQNMSAISGLAFCNDWCGAYGNLPGES